MAAAAVLAVALVVAVALRPAVGAYLLLAVTPLTGGIERGVVTPLVRPSEALLVLVVAGLAARALAGAGRGTVPRLRATAVDWSVLALAYTGSVLPLLWMVARGREVTADDVLYASYIWKYALIFLVVRVAVRTEREVRTCLWTTLAAGSVVALVAALQTVGAPGVAQLLVLYTPGESEAALTGGRGSSTLASPLAVADVMVFDLAIAVALGLRANARRTVVVAAAVVFVLGTIAASQISGFVALGVAVVVLGLVMGRLRAVLLAAVPVGLVATVLLWPVLGRRIGEFESLYGLPRAWVGPHGRIENLTTFFWPPLFEDLNWVTGVRVAARVPAPEAWRDWVWIESGHTWLLWSGGVAFFVACFAFLALGIRAALPVVRGRADAVGAAALACLTVFWVHLVVMAIDVHLTLRGAADLTFALAALALVARPSREQGVAVTGRSS
jgi:hypothetical protein